MSSGIWSAASGAVAQTAALDTAANNIANATTAGYKADTAVFRQTLATALGQAPGTRSQRFAVTRTTTPDLRSGQISQTGRALDVAIPDDKGFFAVAAPGGERYTRAGSFQLDVTGKLVTPEGYAVLGSNHRPIQLAPDAAGVQIAPDGSIQVAGEPSGSSIGMFTFNDLTGLEKEGQVFMRATPQAGRPIAHVGLLEPNALESSNANAITGMTTLVNTSREFEMITKVIEAFSQVEKRAATGIMGR